MAGRPHPARDAALQEIRARRRAAGQKLQRLRSQGVNTGKIDPRLSNAALASMSTRQLQSHLRQLNRFTSRSTSYVPGLGGTPLNGNTWRAYKRAERMYNEKSNDFYSSIQHLVIPTINQTVGQYLKNLRDGTENQAARRQGDYRSFGELVRESAKGITGQAALEKLFKNMANRADPNYLAREAKLQRSILRQMLDRTSNKHLYKKVRELSDEELITLTQYSDFMDKLEGSYAMAKSISTDRPRWQADVYESNEQDIADLIDWAHRHFSEKNPEQDTDDSRPTRDRYGRFVRAGQSLPDPTFARDKSGRFAKRPRKSESE